MLNRRQLRIKALESVYAYDKSLDKNIDVQISYFLKSNKNFFKLYVTCFSLLKELHLFANELHLKNQKHFAGPAFKARPMKHYRKRLLPNNRVGSSRATMRSFDVPGGVSYNNNGNYCDKNGLVHLNEQI